MARKAEIGITHPGLSGENALCECCDARSVGYYEYEAQPSTHGYRCHNHLTMLQDGYVYWLFDQPFHDKAKASFEKAKIYLCRNHPFYGSLILNCDIKWTEDIPVAGIDGLKLYLNPVTTADFSKREWQFLLMHEIQHLAHLHPFRARGRNHRVWNMACDYVINLIIDEEADFAIPNIGCLLDGRFADQSPEYVYSVLMQELSDEEKMGEDTSHGSQSDSGDQNQGNSQAHATVNGSASVKAPSGKSTHGSSPGDKGKEPKAGCDGNETQNGATTSEQPTREASETTDGSGSDLTTCKEWRNVRVDPFHGDVMSAAKLDNMERDKIEAKIKRLTHQAAYHARAMGADLSVANAVIEEVRPKPPWQLKLNHFVGQIVDKDNYTWRRPNKRYFSQNLYMPSLDGNKPPCLMAVVVDVSASISQDQLKLFTEELGGLIASHPHLRFEVYFVNTAITKIKNVGVDDLPLDLSVRGRGGTSFKPAFENIESRALDISGLVYFTDMESFDWPDEPPYPVLWLNYGRPQANIDRDCQRMYRARWGEVVDMI